MKEITLNIIERIFLIGLFNQKEMGHDKETLRAILDDIKEVSISEDEKKEVNLEEVKDDKGAVQSLKWDKDIEKVIKLQEKTVKFVLDYVKEKSDKKELGVADAPLLELENKLK